MVVEKVEILLPARQEDGTDLGHDHDLVHRTIGNTVNAEVRVHDLRNERGIAMRGEGHDLGLGHKTRIVIGITIVAEWLRYKMTIKYASQDEDGVLKSNNK